MQHERLVDTFVELADTLIDDFDMIDFLHLLADRCVELLEVDGAEVLLADPGGTLQVIASSDERVRMLADCQLQTGEGPCVESYRSGASVAHPDLAAAADRWPRFVRESTAYGFGAAYAVPMRLRTDVIGALNVFRIGTGDWDLTVMRTARALVDVATIGLLQHRAIRGGAALADQLQTALTSRVIIEQAKGLIAERLSIDMGAAFAALRGHARRSNRKLGEVARSVVNGEAGVLLGDAPSGRDVG
jgi:hypothetical protein